MASVRMVVTASSSMDASTSPAGRPVPGTVSVLMNA